MHTTARPTRILILDDDPGILEMLNTYLRSLDFEPLPTSRWTEALDLITHNPPDLILLDLQMPTVQGDSVLGFIRQQGHTMPVIIISAYLNEQKMEDLRRLGVKGFVLKPFHLNDLAVTIRKALEQHDATASTPPLELKTPSVTQTDARSTPPASSVDVAVPHAARSPLEEDLAGITATHEKPSSSSHQHNHRHHHHHRRPKSRSLKLYIAVALLCLIGSLAVVALQKLPDYMSGTLEQAVEKSIQSEVSRQKGSIQKLSDKEKEAMRRAFEKK